MKRQMKPEARGLDIAFLQGPQLKEARPSLGGWQGCDAVGLTSRQVATQDPPGSTNILNVYAYAATTRDREHNDIQGMADIEGKALRLTRFLHNKRPSKTRARELECMRRRPKVTGEHLPDEYPRRQIPRPSGLRVERRVAISFRLGEHVGRPKSSVGWGA